MASHLITLLLLLYQTGIVASVAREGVHVNGTTQGPDYFRPEGKRKRKAVTFVVPLRLQRKLKESPPLPFFATLPVLWAPNPNKQTDTYLLCTFVELQILFSSIFVFRYNQLPCLKSLPVQKWRKVLLLPLEIPGWWDWM